MGYSWTFHLTLIKIADLSWRCLRFFISSLWRYPPNKTPCHHLAGVLFFYTLFYFVFIHAYYSFLRFCSHYFHSCGSAPTCPFRRLAPPPSPTSGDGSRFLFIWQNKQVIQFKTMNFFFLSISFPRIRREANCVFRSIATRKRNETLCLWVGKCRALRGDRDKFAYTGQNI